MRKKILVTLLTMALGIATLIGCGDSHDSSSTAENYVVTKDTMNTSTSDVTVPYDGSAYEGPTVFNDVEGSNTADPYVADDYEEFDKEIGRPPEEECDTSNDEGDGEVSATSTVSGNALDGIMVLTLYPVNGMYYAYAIVDTIDPETGATKNILSLQIPTASPGCEYSFFIPEDNQRFGNFQDQFTPDFSKMAITRVDARNQSMHAGWLDRDGVFFDVIAAIGEAETSDFEDPIFCQAIGFTDNGETFVYKKGSDNYVGYLYGTVEYYAVSVNNLQAGSWKMSPDSPYLHDGDDWRWLGEDYRPTDWLDDTHFYVDNGRRVQLPCMLADADTKTMTEFIPGESRLNWGVVASPDKQEIAFMSRAKTTNQVNSAELYTMNLNDQSTNHITTLYSPSDARQITLYGEYSGSHVLCTVLDWK